jgi:hypothetical protein
MSRQLRPRDGRPILAKDPEQRLDMIIRRHGGEVRTLKTGFHLPSPPRVPCADQLDIFAEEPQED